MGRRWQAALVALGMLVLPAVAGVTTQAAATPAAVVAGASAARQLLAPSGTGVSAALTAVAPSRVVDSSAGLGLPAKLVGGRTYTVRPALTGVLPAGRASVLLVRLPPRTYPAPDLYLWDVGERPSAPSVRYQELALVPLAPDGSFLLELVSGPADLPPVAMDLVAYGTVATGGGLTVPVRPTRIGPLAGSTSRFHVAGVAGVPADARSVLLSVEGAGGGPRGAGVSAYPAGSVVSGVALRTGVAMLGSELSAGGDVTVTGLGSASTVTVVGYTTSGPVAPGAFSPVPAKAVYPDEGPDFEVGPGETATIPVAGHWGLPAARVAAVLVYIEPYPAKQVMPPLGLDLRLHPSGGPLEASDGTSFRAGGLRLVRVGPDGAIALTVSPQSGGTFRLGQLALLGYVTGEGPSTPLVLGPRPLAVGEVGVAYASAPLTTADGRPISINTLRGELPPGLTMTRTQITGVPTLAGNYAFSFNVVDTGGHRLRVPAEMSIRPAVRAGDVTQLAVDGGVACALTAGSGVSCWGSWGTPSGRRHRFEPPRGTSLTPRAVEGLPEAVTKIALSSQLGCALGVSRHVYCWGGDWRVTTTRPLPEKYTDIASTGGGSVCGTTTNDQLKCWGFFSRTYGKHVVTGLPAPVRLLGRSCGMVTGDDSNLWCWGTGGDAATALRLPTGLSKPVTQISAQSGITRQICVLSGASAHCFDQERGRWSVKASSIKTMSASGQCGVTTWASIFCWGLGDETWRSLYEPSFVDVEGGLVQTRWARGTLACGLTTAGSVWCAGDNQLGELGTGSFVPVAGPVHVVGLT